MLLLIKTYFTVLIRLSENGDKPSRVCLSSWNCTPCWISKIWMVKWLLQESPMHFTA